MIGEIWDSIVDSISEMMDLIKEFNTGALIMGIATAGLIFILRKFMMVPFTKYMKPLTAIFIEGATYVCAVIVGYAIGLKMLND